MKEKINIIIRIIKDNILIRYLLSKFTLKYINLISLLNSKINKEKYFFEKNYIFDNNKIPIYSDYRYKIKPGWAYFKSLSSLSFLQNLKLLDKTEIDFFYSAIGKRTITKSLDEINLFTREVCEKNRKLFYEKSLENEPLIKKSEKENREIINLFKRSNLKQINFLNSKIKKKINSNSNILEIGFTSGGHSIIAFEELGFNTSGIDNFYNEELNNTKLIFNDIKLQFKPKSNFIIGDITKRNSGLENNFDLIYSNSVLEHIIDIDNAFLEMNNLLKQNGLIFHNYNPYFCVTGGHALGIGDSPFMHVQLSNEEYVKYLSKYRPFESKIAIKWVEENMNKKISQKIMKDKMRNAGFEIIYFNSFNYQKFNYDLTNEIQKKIYKNYDFLTKEDLLGSSVSFIGKKI